jgi:DNA-binding response OmpR family regulator
VKKVIIAESVLAVIGEERSLFNRGGITIYPARSSERILSLHREQKADLIIADISLPVMGGLALIEKVRGDAALRDVSIIMACDGVEDSRTACLRAGANSVIGKPINTTELFARVSDLVVVSRRKDMRVLLRVSVQGAGGGDSPVFAASENISISGMLIETNRAYRLGERLRCSFFVGHSEVKAESRVVRAERSQAGRYRCGIQFMNLETRALVVIDQFVMSKSQGKEIRS